MQPGTEEFAVQIVRLPVFDRMIENRTFKEIAVGESASLSRTVTQQDIELFAIVSGDVNPAHLDPAYAETDMFHKIVAQGILEAGLISAVLGTKLPGPGTIYLGQDLRFLRPVGIGDEITATLTVTEKHEDKGNLVLDCRCTNQKGELVISGTAHVRAPTEKVRRPRYELPDVQLNRHQRFRALMTEAAGHDPVPTAVAYPCDAAVLGSVVEAARARLIAPILVGPIQKIVRAAAAAKADISCFRLVDAPTSEAAVAQAVMLVRKGEASVLMQGSVATGDLLDAVEAPGSGLKTGRRLTHVHLMDVPSYPRPLLITDAALAIAPDLEHKRDIMQNAIDLARVMGIATPRVAIISAIETVDPKLRSTLDAAALCKMADRGQITGGFVDGPLTFDNAVSPAAAARRGIVSEVAGKADILVVPDLEAGDMLVKQLTLLAGADAAGVLLGARVPIVLATGADAERTRLASCAVAVLVARGQAAGVGAACRA
jgi:phosphotransacetylase/acyl dehydratase